MFNFAEMAGGDKPDEGPQAGRVILAALEDPRVLELP